MEFKTTSPWYSVPGVNRFRFVARYPTDEEVIRYYAEFEEHRAKYPEPKPSEAKSSDDAPKVSGWDRVNASWQLQVSHVMPLLVGAEIEGQPWEHWKEDIRNPEIPHFMKRALMKFSDYLFRDPTEGSPNGSDPPEGASTV